MADELAQLEAPALEEAGLPERLTISPRRKAAIMTVALGPSLSAEVFRHMSQEEIDELVLEIAALDKVSPEEKLQVMEEFYDSTTAQDFTTQGGIGFAKDVLERALGDQKAVEIMGRLSTYIRVSPFEFLRKIDPMQIYNFLQAEHPQTVALIMAYLPADSAATVLGMMPQEQQSEVAMRIALMDRTAPEVVREVEQVMERKLSSLINQDLATAGGVKPLVDILNFVDRQTEGNILQTFDERDAELADEVRKLMFVFEDLMLLDDRAIQQLLKEVEMKDVALALKGSHEDVRGKIFGNMSTRAAQMLQEDMEFMGPVKRRAIEEAQGRIVAIVRRLEETGKIEIARGGAGSDDELVV
jgi:flagellar motor switch protein FliG